MATSYKKPRRLNLVSFSLLLILAAFAYFVWKWGPHYLDSWHVDSLLADGGSSLVAYGHLPPEERADKEAELTTKLKKQIHDMGIADPDLDVEIEDDGRKAHLTADWKVVIVHPYLLQPTTVHFHREVVQPLQAGF